MDIRTDIRNIAIIAHVDHGKTTLVDSMLKQSGVFRKNQEIKDRVMDSGDIERERGITILSKNTSIKYEDVKINIIDTPGHSDFGGEVERVLNMVEGVLLLIDAFEGPMPQTKFVLKKALDLELPIIICINKIDKPQIRIDGVIDEALDLLIELGASEEQLDAPFIYTSAKNGVAKIDMKDEGKNLNPLFKTIVDYIPSPKGEKKAPLQLLISTIDYNDYVGRIGIGKIKNGEIKLGQDACIVNYSKKNIVKNFKVSKIYEFEGLDKRDIKNAKYGSIVAISGIEDINIGDTICDINNPVPLPFKEVSKPTLSINILVNNSPFAGREGKYVTTRQIRDRLKKEMLTDVSLKVEETDSHDTFKVSGRGELHLSVLIETMRREGYEFQVSKPEVLYKTKNGSKYEPMELAIIDIDNNYTGVIIEKLGKRKAELVSMGENNNGYTRLEFKIPARGLIGYRQEFLTDTRGSGTMNTIFAGYEKYKGDIARRNVGSIIADQTSISSSYGLNNAQERGKLFIEPGVEVYKGMIVGYTPNGLDIRVHVGKEKKQTNVRASGSDDALKLSPTVDLPLERALEFIEEDELIEVTPKNIRLRKK